jgi:hypothetical protein
VTQSYQTRLAQGGLGNTNRSGRFSSSGYKRRWGGAQGLPVKRLRAGDRDRGGGSQPRRAPPTPPGQLLLRTFKSPSDATAQHATSHDFRVRTLSRTSRDSRHAAFDERVSGRRRVRRPHCRRCRSRSHWASARGMPNAALRAGASCGPSTAGSRGRTRIGEGRPRRTRPLAVCDHTCAGLRAGSSSQPVSCSSTGGRASQMR